MQPKRGFLALVGPHESRAHPEHRRIVIAVRQFIQSGIGPEREFTKPRYALVRPIHPFFPHFPSPVTVRKVNQVGVHKQASNCKLLFWNGLGRLPN